MHELHNNWCKLFIILFNIIRKLLLDIDFKTKYFLQTRYKIKKFEYKNI